MKAVYNYFKQIVLILLESFALLFVAIFSPSSIQDIDEEKPVKNKAKKK